MKYPEYKHYHLFHQLHRTRWFHWTQRDRELDDRELGGAFGAFITQKAFVHTIEIQFACSIEIILYAKIKDFLFYD